MKIALLTIAIYRFSAFPIKIPQHLSIDLERGILNFIWKNKRPRRAKGIQSNKRTLGGITIPDLKLYYRAIVIKMRGYWYENSQVDQLN